MLDQVLAPYLLWAKTRQPAAIDLAGSNLFHCTIDELPGVRECSVVGIPDERWGERVCAVVQPNEGAEPTFESIVEHCRGRIAAYKLPRALVLVDHVVRSPVGKPDYRWAKQTALENLT